VTRVALATAEGFDDPDQPLLVAALAQIGIEAEAARWRDPGVAWDAFDATVVRSAWDYTEDLDAFLAWARRVPGLVNPASVVRWNSDKRYLADLAGSGVPIVPTTFVAPGEAPVLPDGDVIVKPSVGAGSRLAASFAPGERDDAIAHVARIGALGLTALVQPLVATVAIEGETDVIVLDGEISHAVRKRVPITAGKLAHPSGAETSSAGEVTAGQRAVIAMALRNIPVTSPPCYARVDLFEGPDGPVVNELELIEPFLFLSTSSGAPERFAGAIARRVGLGLRDRRDGG
jgi:glutathione synthase/RimK-type ligase-like ATP-grasp enzyme